MNKKNLLEHKKLKNQFSEKWKLFIDSFKFKSNFLYIVLYDLLFYAVIIPLFLLYSFIINKKMAAIDPDVLSTFSAASIMNVTAAQAQQIQQTSQAMQGFVYTLIGGIILLIIITLLAFTLSRTLIWNHLLKKKFELKKYLKFNLLNILLAVILIIFLYIILKLRAPVTNLFLRISFNFAFIIASILFLLIFIAVIYFASLIYINYTKTAKIFDSFGKTFKLIKTKFETISISYLLIFLVTIIVSLIAMIRWLLPVSIQSYFSYAIVLLFLAWMRIYIVDTIKK